MRPQQEINENQCDKCGKIQVNGELTCAGEGKWEGLALCNNCIIELEKN